MKYVALVIGAGFAEDAVEAARALPFDFIGADAGTIDVGPYQLGGLGTIFSEQQCRRDLAHMLDLSVERGVPLLVGSCGGDGSDRGVDWFAGMIRDLAAKYDRPLKLTKIYSEPDREWLKDKVSSGRVRPLPGAVAPYTTEAVDRSTRIVGVMGAEPFLKALEDGPDIVLAGRSTDTAFFAAPAIRAGLDEGLAWQAAKIAECGACVANPPLNDLLYVEIGEDSFAVSPLARGLACTPRSVAAHQLYETSDPFRLVEPSGVLDTTAATYRAAGQGRVEVSGGVFHPAAQYTVKLEGVELVGYQSITMASFTDPKQLAEFDDWLHELGAMIDEKVRRVLGDEADTARMTMRTYGDGSGTSLFPGAATATGVEAFVLLDVVAPTQALANSYASIAWHTLIHFPVKGWPDGWITAAWPYNPPVIDRGAVYEFNVNHVVEVSDPLECLRFETEILNA